MKKILAFGTLCLTAICINSNQSTFAQQGNGQFISNLLSGKCIDVAGAPGNQNGAPLQLWDCETSGFNADNGSKTDQQWSLTSDGFIKNTLSNKCLDVSGAPGTATGTPLILYDCEPSGPNTDQRWTLTSKGFIKNILSGKCIDVAGAPGNQNGAPLQLWDCETSGFNADNGSKTDQQWKFAAVTGTISPGTIILPPETSETIKGDNNKKNMDGGYAEAEATFYRNGLAVIETHSVSNSFTQGTKGSVFIVGSDRKGRAVFVSPVFNIPTACSKLDTCSSNRRDTIQHQINSELAKYVAKIDVFVQDRGTPSLRESIKKTITETCGTYDDLPPAAKAGIAVETGFVGCGPK
jgi:Ricin-type beta-trefoil lectin domain